MRWECSIQVFVDNIEPLVVLPVFQLVLIHALALTEDPLPYEPPSEPSVGWRWPLSQTVSELLWVMPVEVLYAH